MVALCGVMAAWATDYTGLMTNNATSGSGDEQASKDNVLVTVEKNANGTYKAILHNFSIVHKGNFYDLGTLEYDQLQGTTRSDGYTYVSGTKQIGVKDIQGYEELIPEQYRQYLTDVGSKTFPVNFTGQFNDDRILAHVDTEITIKASYYGATATVFHTIMYIDYMGEAIKTEPDPIVGDVNGDEKVDVDDVNAVINIILGATASDELRAASNVTGDGKVDVEDVNAIINIILKV